MKLSKLFLEKLEVFDVLSGISDGELPDGVTRVLGRCQTQLEPPSAFFLNENATLHQLAAGMFYNTFPEDFSILAVIRLTGKILIGNILITII